jgi:peptidoglycan/xylan/chitin deacetylase (PgdA/CDA1 family)
MPLSRRLPIACAFGVCLLMSIAGRNAAAEDGSPAMPANLSEAGNAATAASAAEPFAPYVGKKYRHGLRSQKKIALTFDDGPHPRLTPQAVQALKAENAQATFFMLGEMIERYPETARMVHEAGFEIGNHSHSHANLIKLSPEGIGEEIESTSKRIESVIGGPVRLFRPPYGNIDKRVTEATEKGNLVMCLWSLDPRDWESGSTPAAIARKVVSQAQPGDIVCMHDIKSNTVEALPAMIKGLKEAGFELVTVGRLLEEEANAPPEEREAPAATAPVQPTTPPVMSLDESSEY